MQVEYQKGLIAYLLRRNILHFEIFDKFSNSGLATRGLLAIWHHAVFLSSSTNLFISLFFPHPFSSTKLLPPLHMVAHLFRPI